MCIRDRSKEARTCSTSYGESARTAYFQIDPALEYLFLRIALCGLQPSRYSMPRTGPATPPDARCSYLQYYYSFTRIKQLLFSFSASSRFPNLDGIPLHLSLIHI
eukprot:TRINITY_DN7991_c0_g1_i3.p4 TRINITY_DN7991_c0_g1~~TRINITY_DN7991_c0_g1_i3.p4  ORF type:complete len:105 (+),score=0.30 TRINITY_DN7991_c0_g1_i3:180-494(+)